MKLNKCELIEINGGASAISGTLVNAFVKAIDALLEVGRSLGSAIRRVGDGKSCPY